MNVFGGNEALIPSPVRKDPSGRYVTLPESFGDLLCESAQYMAEPRFGIMFRPWPSARGQLEGPELFYKSIIGYSPVRARACPNRTFS